jgi:hypothetical protein
LSPWLDFEAETAIDVAEESLKRQYYSKQAHDKEELEMSA